MSTEVEFALKKQRLQYRSAELRARFAEYAYGVAPVLRAGDAVVDGVRWIRRHPEVIAAAGLGLVIARPRGVLRWARRGVAAWQAWGRVRDWLAHHVPTR
ncbi:MAG TPA: YqjK family protein [Rhodocyclaceae bacterium]